MKQIFEPMLSSSSGKRRNEYDTNKIHEEKEDKTEEREREREMRIRETMGKQCRERKREKPTSSALRFPYQGCHQKPSATACP